jgi:hypothetical protein
MKEGKMKEKVMVTAYHERDSKRYRRFVIRKDYEKGGGIVGLIYVPKITDVPETVVVNLEVGKEGDEDLLWDL